MRSKRIISVVLLAFVGASIGYLVITETRGTPAADETTNAVVDVSTVGNVDHKLIAYYFHRTKRCRTCLTIEALAHEALVEGFPDAIERGELEWRTANLDEPVNEHFVEEYAITGSTVVLVEMRDGKVQGGRNLARVWDLVGDEMKFKVYVEAEALVYLEEGL